MATARLQLAIVALSHARRKTKVDETNIKGRERDFNMRVTHRGGSIQLPERTWLDLLPIKRSTSSIYVQANFKERGYRKSRHFRKSTPRYIFNFFCRCGTALRFAPFRRDVCADISPLHKKIRKENAKGGRLFLDSTESCVWFG